MKLIKLVIASEYKNLKGVYNFSEHDGYIALIGLNGSGKSNILEAISLIFNGIFNKKRIPFLYEIEYEINGDHYIRGTRFALKNDLKIKEIEMIYPSSLIACYSGEDLRLWHKAYEDYYNHYFNKAINNKFFKQQLLYINKYSWSLALISLLASRENMYIKELLGITELEEVNITLYYDKSKLITFKSNEAMKWFLRIIDNAVDKSDERFTVNMATLASYDINTSSAIINKQPKEKTIFQFLYLLSQPQKNNINKVDKIVNGFDIKIGNINFRDLSEGEKKIILIECITKVLADKESFVILDEPDAHVHVARKNELLKIINEYKGEVIFTTHSPVLLNCDETKPKNIFYVNDGAIEEKNILEKICGLSGGLIDYIEGSLIMNSKDLLVVEGIYDKRYLSKAIKVFAKLYSKYNRLKDIAIFPAGSSSQEPVVYDEFIKPAMHKLSKVVFLYDYDKGGFDGWCKTSTYTDLKCDSIFYQHDYTTDYKPTVKKDIQDSDTVLVEDLFSTDSYKCIKNDIDKDFASKVSSKDYRNGNRADGAVKIKQHIQEKYNIFDDEWFIGFQPVLDKLLDEFK